MKFCWQETDKDTFFSSDKWRHFALHFIIAGVLTYFTEWWIAILVSEFVGLMTEIVETTDWWALVVKKIWPEEGRARCISIKDLIVNQIGLLAGVLAVIIFLIK